jgi:hypothetical protein
MSERQIQDDFRKGMDEVISAAGKRWYREQFKRSGLDEARLAVQIGYDRSELNRLHNGQRRLQPSLMALLTIAFSKQATRDPSFKFSPPEHPSPEDVVLGGLLYALNCAGERRPITGSRCGPLFYFCLQALTGDRDWCRAVSQRHAPDMESSAQAILKRARERAARVRHGLPESLSLFNGCPPDASPKLARADDFCELLRHWREPWQQVHRVILLQVEP